MDFEGITPGEVAIKIFSKNYGYYLSSENYFFEEGTGLLYNNAKYALVVVDDEGNIYIKNLCDKDRNVIEKGQLSTDDDMLQTDEEEAVPFWVNDSWVVEDSLLIEDDSLQIEQKEVEE